MIKIKRKPKDIVSYTIAELDTVENYYISMLTNIYTSVYQWEGLPDTVDHRWLEQSLIKRGKVLFYREFADLGLVAFPCQASADLNPYGYPKEWRTFGANGYSARVSNRDGVFCYNTNNGYSDLHAILMFARRLTYTAVSMDINVILQRYPGMIRCSQEEKLSMENLFQNYLSGVPLTFVDKNFNMDTFEHIDFNTPYVADKLQYTLRDILADALNYIGVQYSSSNKRERLASTEIDSNIGFTEANRVAHLFPRQDAAERINKKFGTDISVNIRDDMVNMLKIADINPFNQKQESTLYGSSSGETTIKEGDK